MMPDTKSWPFDIGSKRGQLEACPHRPVLHPFPEGGVIWKIPYFGFRPISVPD